MITPDELDPTNANNYEYNSDLGLYFYKNAGLGYTASELANLCGCVEPAGAGE